MAAFCNAVVGLAPPMLTVEAGISQHIDAEVGGQFFRRCIDGRRHHAINVPGLQPRIRDGPPGGIEHHGHGRLVRPFYIAGLADPDDRSLVAEILHETALIIIAPRTQPFR